MSFSISAIVPVYNTERYLEECLGSLVEQTVSFYEIILVNDGSTDNSLSICEKYNQQYDNILLISQENQGLSVARNNGMKRANGQYIVFVDSDDFVSKQMNEYLINVLLREKCDVLYYSAEVKNEVDREFKANCYIRAEYLCEKKMSGEKFFRLSYPGNYIVSACCAAYRTSFLKENNILFPRGIYFEDNPFFVKTALNANEIICVPEKLYIRRYRENSIMISKMNLKKCEDLLTVQLLQWECICSFYRIKDKDVFFRNFILEQAIGALRRTSYYEEQLSEKYIVFLNTFMVYWHELFEDTNLGWNELYALSKLGRLWEKFIGIGEYRNVFNMVEKNFRQEIINKLQKIPMREEIKIGIYGIGMHTRVLLELYNKLIGTVKSDFYFIVTKKDTNFFMGKKVVCCSEIPSDTKVIVVSSRIYQTEMEQQLVREGIDINKILLLYDKEDRYDLTLAKEIL